MFSLTQRLETGGNSQALSECLKLKSANKAPLKLTNQVCFHIWSNRQFLVLTGPPYLYTKPHLCLGTLSIVITLLPTASAHRGILQRIMLHNNMAGVYNKLGLKTSQL